MLELFRKVTGNPSWWPLGRSKRFKIASIARCFASYFADSNPHIVSHFVWIWHLLGTKTSALPVLERRLEPFVAEVSIRSLLCRYG